MFTYQSARLRRSLLWLVAIVLGAWTMLFGLGANLTVVHAGLLSSRSVTMESSVHGFTEGKYTVAFTASGTNVSGIVIDVCSNSPIIGEVCNAPAGFDWDAAGPLTVASAQYGNLTIDTDHTTASTLVLDSSGNNSAAAVTLSLGTGGGTADGVNNPSGLGSFYARIITYDLNSSNDAYDDEAPGSSLDDGGIALATTDALNITARVQEILRFCVGDTDAHSAHDCTDISGSTINIGVLDPTNSSVSKSSVNGVAGDKNGYAMISTNAVGGATVSYIGKTLESGGNHIDAVGTTRAELVADAEKFGMDATLDQTKGGTSNMTRDAEFNEASHYTFAGSQYTADTIASASTVVSKETLIFDFAADASMVTPTGIYTTAVTYIGTGLF